MSARSTQIIGGPDREHAWVESATNALRVHVVNGGGGGGGDVNLVQYGGVAVGAGNALHVQPGTGAVFAVGPVTPGVGALNLGKAEDAAHVSGDVGVMALAVRVDADTTLAADGDYHPLLVDSTGALKVNGTVSVVGGVVVTQGTSPWVVGQATHANLNATVRLQDGNSATLLDVVVNESSVLGQLTPGGLVPLFHVTDAPDAPGGTWTAGRMNEAGSIYVAVTSGSVAATQATSPWVVGDGGGSLTVDGTVNAVQSGTWNIGTVNALIPGTGATNLGKAEDAAHTTGDVGVMALAVRRDSEGTTVSANNEYESLQLTSTGRLRVNAHVVSGNGTNTHALEIYRSQDVFEERPFGIMSQFEVVDSAPGGAISSGSFNHGYISASDAGIIVNIPGNVAVSVTSVVPGTGSGFLGKAEDGASASGDVGVMALAVRRDTLSVLTSANNDFATLNTNNVGALWVKEYGVANIVLSGSTRGRPIQITGTNSAGAVTLHTATTTSGEVDRVFIWLTNTSSSSVTVTIEFGTTGTANELKIIVPANETVLAVDGALLGGAATDVIEAYASTASVVNAIGRVERLAA